jgi:uncharacterized iron-regulated membrane protein
MGRDMKDSMSFRKVIFWSHLIVGLSVGLVVVFLSATGILLAFRPQILSSLEKSMNRMDAPEGQSQRLSLNSLAEIVKKNSPEGAKITGLSLAADPRTALSFNLGREGLFYLDPYKGKILGEGAKGARAFFEKMEGLHRWFGVEGKSRDTAKLVKGAFNLGFFLLVLSGFYLWWPNQWTRKVFKTIGILNLRLKGKQKDWNWHNTIGFWCAPVLLLITLTGLIMSYGWANDLLYRLTGNQPPVRPAAANPGPLPGERDKAEKKSGEGPVQKHRDKPAGKFVGWDKLFETAEKQAPHWRSMNFRLAQRGGNNVTVQVVEEGSSTYARSSLTLNPETAEVLKWEPSSEYNLGRRLRAWVKPLHTGEALGLFGQILNTLASLGAMLLVWTGWSLAWRRFFGAAPTKR